MIRANFRAYGKYIVDRVYQWDKNRDLIIEGLNLTTAPEIHFVNGAMEKAIVRQSTMKNGVVSVRIPNSLLQSDSRINVYICVYEGDEFKVVTTVDVPIVPRKRPGDYVIEDSDEEIYSFNELETKLSYKLGIPDYAKNSVVIEAINTSWEVTEDGYVQLRVAIAEPSYKLARLTINDVTVVYTDCNGANYSSPLFPVKGGDIVSTNDCGAWDSVRCIYYPLR